MKLDDADKTWSVLAERLETFISNWEEKDKAPDLEKYLPPDPPELRRMVLVELIKVDLEYRWQHRKQPKHIEQYASEFDELKDEAGLPCDLIYEEFHIRRMSGEEVDLQEFVERFPHQATELARLLPADSVGESTCLYVKKETGDVEVGQTVDDFHLLCKLGAGAFASVFLARQNSMQRLVALKVSGDKGSEPQTLAQLDHPHIVRVYDQRQLRDRGLRLLYMQYVPGGTLHDVIRHLRNVPVDERSGSSVLAAVDESLAKRGEAPPIDSHWREMLAEASWPEVICRMGAQLASALHYAEQRGVLHRDVKPANVLIAADALPKLADFNISYSSKVEGTTAAAYFGGSLAYMSPEQLEACNPIHPRKPDELDGRADLYSLGVVLWEMLHGERPFVDEKVEGAWSKNLEIMAARRRDIVVQPSRKGSPDLLRDELQRVLSASMDPDPELRWADGAQMARRLQLCLHPHAQQLLHPPQGSWRRVVRKSPLAILIAAVLFPHVLATALNIYYNWVQIVQPLGMSWRDFLISILVINALAYPMGVAVICFCAWPVTRRLRGLVRDKPSTSDVPSALRNRTLRLGHTVALIGIAAWFISGLAFPISLNLMVEEFPLSAYWHFPASLVLCCLIATAYPFFHVTFLAIQVYYPTLIERLGSQAEDQDALIRLGRSAGVYLVLAGGVPMLSIAVLIVSQLQHTILLGILSIVGLVGLAVSFFLYRTIQRDLFALTELNRSLNLRIASSEQSTY